MTPPHPSLVKAVPVVADLLDELNREFGGKLERLLGPEWKIPVGSILFDAWAHGYTTGFADSDNVLKEWKRRE